MCFTIRFAARGFATRDLRLATCNREPCAKARASAHGGGASVNFFAPADMVKSAKGTRGFGGARFRVPLKGDGRGPIHKRSDGPGRGGERSEQLSGGNSPAVDTGPAGIKGGRARTARRRPSPSRRRHSRREGPASVALEH